MNGRETAWRETAGRDRSIDAARAVAIAGVVTGHWLVTALVPGPAGVTTASPLTAMPALAPVSWLLQTLGLLFFAGGYAATRHPSASRTGRGSGIARLMREVLVLLTGRALVILAGAALGVPAATLHTIATLTASPLWFLLPYLALRLATAPLRRLVHRVGAAAVLPFIATVAATDLGLLPGRVALLAWAVPWLLGMVLAGKDDTTPGHWPAAPWAGAALVCWGATAVAALILLAGYPPSAVGIPGAGRSNLDPPSLLAVALAATQIGVFLLLREPLTWQLLVSGALMALGLYLHLTERHEHQHVHDAIEHEHAHVHDEHHRHPHDGPVTEPHTHWHRHEKLRHSHPHYPDLHHRHSH